MTFRRISSFILALCLALGLGGCKRKAPDLPLENTGAPVTPDPVVVEAAPGADTLFTVCWASEAGFNPYTCTSSYNRLLLPLLYEGMFSLDAAFSPQPQLCESYSLSGDGLTWTLKLRSDVLFSDGSRLTAADVVASLTAARSSAAYSGRFGNILSFSALDSGSLTISLEVPSLRLASLLDIPIVKAGTEGDTIPVGTGPYGFTGGETPLLSANSRHRDGDSLPLDRIYLAQPEGETLTTDFEQGLLDLFVTDLNSSRSIHFRGNQETRHFYTSTFYYLGFNLAEGRVFSDGAARADIAQAVDRQALTRDAFDGYLTAAVLAMHPGTDLYDRSLAAAHTPQSTNLSAYFDGRLMSDYDGDGLLEAYSGGRVVDFQVDFIVSKTDSHKLAAARQIAEALSAVGYPIVLRELDWEAYLSALESGDFDLYLAETTLSADFDLRSLLGTGGSLNYGGVSDSRLDTLLARFLAAAPDSGAWDASTQLLAQIAENNYIVPIGFMERALYSHRGVIRGLAPTQNNVFYGIADWTVVLTAE